MQQQNISISAFKGMEKYGELRLHEIMRHGASQATRVRDLLDLRGRA